MKTAFAYIFLLAAPFSALFAHDPATDTDLKIPVLTPDKSVDVSA